MNSKQHKIMHYMKKGQKNPIEPLCGDPKGKSKNDIWLTFDKDSVTCNNCKKMLQSSVDLKGTE